MCYQALFVLHLGQLTVFSISRRSNLVNNREATLAEMRKERRMGRNNESGHESLFYKL